MQPAAIPVVEIGQERHHDMRAAAEGRLRPLLLWEWARRRTIICGLWRKGIGVAHVGCEV